MTFIPQPKIQLGPSSIHKQLACEVKEDNTKRGIPSQWSRLPLTFDPMTEN